MGQALYRKYRSKSLQEIIGQEHITTTLEQALKQGRISHAYLFTGPRGVGKTSIARILAHKINGLPYTTDEAHIDIIEIDAASNRRIDEIRELRDKVYVAPVSAKYKVYIIDEVHMLTKEAFNALLKTLEEPPAHVVFILATTDAHKLPDTIVSRTQRFTFKPVDTAKVSRHLAAIAKKEKIEITPEALQLLAEHGEGSFRDSISLLDQLSSHDKHIGEEQVRALLGMPPQQAIGALIEALGTGASDTLMTRLNELLIQGYQPSAVAKQLSNVLRRELVNNHLQISVEAALELLAKLIEVPTSHDPERFLEIILLRAQGLPEVAELNKTAGANQKTEIRDDPTPAAKKQTKEDARQATATLKKTAPASRKLDDEIWPEILQTLKRKHNTLYGVARMAQPSFLDDGTLQLAFAFAFHEKRIKEASNSQKLAEIIQESTGQTVRVECVLDPSATPPKVALEAPTRAASSEITTINNIFGATELLES